MNKPKISPFVYSASLNNVITNNQVTVVPMGIINTIHVKYIPTSYSFAITFIISNIDISKNHNLVYKFLDPDGNQLIKTPSFPINNLQNNNNNEINFNMDIRNFDFPKEGIYSSEVLIDDEIIGTFPIEVKKNVPN